MSLSPFDVAPLLLEVSTEAAKAAFLEPPPSTEAMLLSPVICVLDVAIAVVLAGDVDATWEKLFGMEL